MAKTNWAYQVTRKLTGQEDDEGVVLSEIQGRPNFFKSKEVADSVVTGMNRLEDKLPRYEGQSKFVYYLRRLIFLLVCFGGYTYLWNL